ncbi:putative transglutaminase elicitor [Plasmopara halstedii]
MRASCIFSTAFALYAPQIHGAPDRNLEALTEGDTLAAMEQFLGVKLERKFKDIPTSARIEPAPWNGPMWETYADSINYPWQRDQPSPAEKYAKAFGIDAKELMDKVSANFGIYSVENSSVQCAGPCQGEVDVCTSRGSSGVCIPRWSGLSHGMAPAAIFEKEPLCPIKFNNVDFHPNDIKGLISAVYADADIAKMTISGGQSNRDDSVSLDQYGRPTEISYRDVTPAFYHITVANILGNLKRSLIIDRYPGRAVWDQALSGFEVYEQNPMTPEEAAKTYFNTDKYPFNDQASQIIHVESNVFWNNKPFPTDEFRPLPQNEDFGASYSYLLELSTSGDIVGGEWVNKSILNHADDIYLHKGKPAADFVTIIGIRYANVLRLIDMSAACTNVTQN